MKKHAAEVGIIMDTSKRGTPPVDGVKKRGPSDSVKDIVQTVDQLPEIPYKLLSASAHARALPILRSISSASSQSGIPAVAMREITRISGLVAAVWVETMGRVAGYLGANSDPNDPNNPLVPYAKMCTEFIAGNSTINSCELESQKQPASGANEFQKSSFHARRAFG